MDHMKPSRAQAASSRQPAELRVEVVARLDDVKRRAVQASSQRKNAVPDVCQAFGFMPQQARGNAIIRWRNI
ncbi:MAG: hypothetical protein RBT42_07640 [Aquabacterium sp.]|nr:hypothetical protein [Aquabacterium sp.]